MGHITNTFKCIIYIPNVYILKQEVTGIIAGIIFLMAKRWEHDVNINNMDTNLGKYNHETLIRLNLRTSNIYVLDMQTMCSTP